ncbi:phage tail tube protein [Neptunicoccus sediminis]|uniref:phage tail tube protein n=1 Tax=Neptunicoccus sediminis TaxID=1892596 RepID=UPI000845C648|nr:phage tail tube protein [Neptunicoccus sediminis]
MAGISGRQVGGLITSLYYSATKIASKDEANTAAAAISANQVVDLADLGTLNKTRAVVDVPAYGEDFVSKLVGQASADDFSINVTYNNDNAVHTAIRDDDGKTEHSFIIKFENGSAVTYAVFDGYISAADVTAPLDDRIQMDITVARTGAATWIDIA